jgi:hypothetical protein
MFGDTLAAFWGDYGAFESWPGETIEQTVFRLEAEAKSNRAQAEQSAPEANAQCRTGSMSTWMTKAEFVSIGD